MPFTFFNFGGFQSGEFGGFGAGSARETGERPERRPRKAVGKPWMRTCINLAVTLIFAAVYFYLELPALNLHSEEFYAFAFLTCAVYCGCAVITSGFQGEGTRGYLRFMRKQCTVPFFLVIALVVIVAAGSVSSWVILRSGSYSRLLPLSTGDFAAEVEEISYDQIPMLDADSAQRLGNRKLGELADMVSQFEVANDYCQINYNGRPVRVTPLRYGDIVKWFNNRAKGLPAYLVIDMVTQNVEVVRLENGIRYTTAEHFSRNLHRHLRFRYPLFIFDDPAFEIDEDGRPYWVCPRITRKIGLFGGTDIIGAVLVDAVTGESSYYPVEEVPEWVDHVYTADLIIQQYDYYGQYHNGFINSILGQRDVTLTTEGYNYIAIDDDVYMYTGITSVGTDESNIGFILSNQRTKETHFYSVAGAEEFSAMDSAEGQVQHLNYRATFPLLLNIADQPTYFMALKDAAGLVKMYAMVNVRQYQIVATGVNVAECERSYRGYLKDNGLIREEEARIETVETETVTGQIMEIRTAVMGGDSMYFLRLAGDGRYYVISAAAEPSVVILNVGDPVEITAEAGQAGTIVNASAVKKNG